MGSPLFQKHDQLVTITVLGKSCQVPQKSNCLRAFQFISPETISYGRFCWNQECQLCRISYTMAAHPDIPARSVLACKITVAEGMQITEVSEELRYNLPGPSRSSTLRPGYDDV